MLNQDILTRTNTTIVFFQLIGGVRIYCGKKECTIKLTRVTQSLLIYLLLGRGKLHNRDVLANLFWGDQDMQHARNCLSTTLWRLRLAFKKEGVQSEDYIVSSESGEIGFIPRGEYWLDLAIFDENITHLLRKPVKDSSFTDVQTLEECLEENSGELLEGMYEDWALRAREHKHLLYLDGLSYLLQYYKLHQEIEKALGIGQRILERDPLREEVHREMIQMYASLGRRALALKQYESCRRLLADELGIQPMPETEKAMRTIAKLGPKAGLEEKDRSPTYLEQAIQQLKSANEYFLTARDQYHKALSYLEKYSEAHTNK